MGRRLQEVRPNVVSDRSSSQCDDDASEEGEVVSWIGSVPHGRQDESGCCRVVRAPLITHPFEPVCRLNVPVVEENLEAGGKLDVEDPQVGDEVPARRAVAVVAVEAEAGGVVDGVSKRPDEVILGSGGQHGQVQVDRLSVERRLGDEVIVDVSLHGENLTHRQKDQQAEEGGGHFTHHLHVWRGFALPQLAVDLPVGLLVSMATGISLDEGDVVVVGAGGSGQDPHEVTVVAEVLEQTGHPPYRQNLLSWCQMFLFSRHSVVDFKRQAGDLLCDHHHGSGEVGGVHAVVEDVDSSDLTQTQVAERHQQAVFVHVFDSGQDHDAVGESTLNQEVKRVPSEAEESEVESQQSRHHVSDEGTGFTGMEEETKPEGRQQSTELTDHKVHLVQRQVGDLADRLQEAGAGAGRGSALFSGHGSVSAAVSAASVSGCSGSEAAAEAP